MLSHGSLTSSHYSLRNLTFVVILDSRFSANRILHLDNSTLQINDTSSRKHTLADGSEWHSHYSSPSPCRGWQLNHKVELDNLLRSISQTGYKYSRWLVYYGSILVAIYSWIQTVKLPYTTTTSKTSGWCDKHYWQCFHSKNRGLCPEGVKQHCGSTGWH